MGAKGKRSRLVSQLFQLPTIAMRGLLIAARGLGASQASLAVATTALLMASLALLASVRTQPLFLLPQPITRRAGIEPLPYPANDCAYILNLGSWTPDSQVVSCSPATAGQYATCGPTAQRRWRFADAAAACGARRYDRSAAGALLAGRRLTFAGDSIARHLYAALLRLAGQPGQEVAVKHQDFGHSFEVEKQEGTVGSTGSSAGTGARRAGAAATNSAAAAAAGAAAGDMPAGRSRHSFGARFYWRPYPANLTDLFGEWEAGTAGTAGGSNEGRPGAVVLSAALWHLLHVSNATEFGQQLQQLRAAAMRAASTAAAAAAQQQTREQRQQPDGPQSGRRELSGAGGAPAGETGKQRSTVRKLLAPQLPPPHVPRPRPPQPQPQPQQERQQGRAERQRPATSASGVAGSAEAGNGAIRLVLASATETYPNRMASPEKRQRMQPQAVDQYNRQLVGSGLPGAAGAAGGATSTGAAGAAGGAASTDASVGKPAAATGPRIAGAASTSGQETQGGQGDQDSARSGGGGGGRGLTAGLAAAAPAPLLAPGGPFRLLDMFALTAGCGEECSSDGVHSQPEVYDVGLQLLLNLWAWQEEQVGAAQQATQPMR